MSKMKALRNRFLQSLFYITPAMMLIGGLAYSANEYFRGKVYFKNATLILGEGSNLQTGTSTGTEFGTAAGQKIGFHGATPVAQGTAMTAASTNATASAPSTPDFAIQDLTNSSGYGFVTADEGQTILQVINNLQTRVSEVEAIIENHGLAAAN